MAAKSKQQPAAPPPFYVATDTLWFGGPGAVPVAAYAPGDRITPAALAEGPPEWAALVAVPEQFSGAQPPPPPGPAQDRQEE